MKQNKPSTPENAGGHRLSLSDPIQKEHVLKTITEHIQNLPPMPNTVIKLRAALQNPKIEFTSLVPLIEQDAALCADLLRFANSAVYGLHYAVDTVTDALLYFGMHNLVDFVAVSFANKMARSKFQQLRHIDDYFHHSSRVSAACYLLAWESGLGRHEREVCKIGGLLHNIGRLVILLATNQHNATLSGIPWKDRQQLIAMEEEVYGLHHCEVGMRICKHWKFPDTLAEGIGLHHRPVYGNRLCVLAAYIFLGELLVIDDLPIDIISKEFPAWALEQLGLTHKKMEDAKRLFREGQKIL